ncbi:hypothetical protein F9C11_20460 [Amycolatopsis sp. VS8301801F10]|uniref:hypothetical protein n=1 Tax=unclassified Amycolatopsis TaxID=2618356 RepID=UPI0038FC1033
MADLYQAGATIDGDWIAGLLAPARPLTVEDVLGSLAEACNGVPVTAAVVPGDDGRVRGMVLYRHPSVTHGTPSIPVHGGLVAFFRRRGWTRRIVVGPTSAVTVAMGLREGYSPDAAVHEHGEVEQALRRARAHSVSVQTVTLMSARRLPDGPQTHQEPGVLLTSPHVSDLAVIRRIAADLRQHQIVVIDHRQRATYTLRQEDR